jgi:amino-acid N-acetyltransferase
MLLKIYMMEIKEAQLYREKVVALLSAEKLPVADLPDTLDNFFVVTENDEIAGVIGLEIYGSSGLLRSLAVSSSLRGKGIAAVLVDQLEAIAAEKGLEALYLLTETAKDYFEGKGYEHVARMDIPDEVKASSEFMHVCPESAIAMVKYIGS